MSDIAAQTPLVELMESIPEDARLEWEDKRDECFSSWHMAPVGRYCHEAAKRIRHLEAVLDAESRNRNRILNEQEKRIKELEDRLELYPVNLKTGETDYEEKLPEALDGIGCRTETIAQLDLHVMRLKAAIYLASQDVLFFAEDQTPCLLLNDVFGPCADAESVPPEDLYYLKLTYQDEGYDGLVKWAKKRRGM